ncbi:riboflavin biosynthesis protein RibD [Acinetobacter sp. ANC 3929]|uniref:bifunctional diaminohydroxyphosphoribosylaminopyrimidine deaminase/5-amino-6-(5-phosphoribosylamino)uracil reductase RibD n=1 Tax=unclassified Acinetobacter TaxID=196816 RepID=UPI0002CF7A83|nr:MULTISPECIES: bifunctional diaminohydroxyphosphoribosylaminopyrimidine deaminase/5-amino-6-(5-phosphoribosylamino)uracil reductase RibD [unclassified Acinetobacter]ENW78931.1 riboflavin biosynthesis protein RibD [Acinetobacter sp. ANC 3929]MCH7352528.1 bifunctional diaminohydroxyphosphoribosylaminopyrimidine deaminase/5-amino-6-(5-phosphoribosylamino)uracil reductase RibD [Acinetobacter sp. NIPH 2023]MCH7356358.1 bifunctional diaminohydroxyphosphoribosylaminopyrimidine deaminase/5-amino-6-(5-
MSELTQDHLSEHQYWMQQAIALARRGQYSTKPNPNVGCVIIKDGQLIGEGYHPKAGQPHAEVFALRQAGENAKAATAYVTLEPCAHYGRTPPCAEALVKAQVEKVVIACSDPNPLVAGKGVKILQDAGIEVETGICTESAKTLNFGFLKAMSTGLPYVRLKIASSLDGRTAMASGESKWITGSAARQDVQHWRAISGAVITGIQTVLADDCELNVRSLEGIDLTTVVQPKRIVLDRQGQLPLSAKILQQAETVMVMTPFRQELADLGVIQLTPQPLNQLLQTLSQQYQIYDVLVEAGATLSTAFLQQGLVDEMISYVAPTLLGQSARAMFNAEFSTMAEQLRFELVDVTQLGQDIRLRLLPIQEMI